MQRKNAQPHSLSQEAHILTGVNDTHWETTAYHTPLKPHEVYQVSWCCTSTTYLSKVVAPNIGFQIMAVQLHIVLNH